MFSVLTVSAVPYGAGSSVEGNFSSPHGGICVDFTHMDKILAVHPDEFVAPHPPRCRPQYTGSGSPTGWMTDPC